MCLLSVMNKKDGSGRFYMFCYRPLNFLPRIRWRGRRAFLRALCLRSSSKNSSLWRRRRRAFLRALCLHSSVDRINPVFFCSGMAAVGDSSRRFSYSRPHLGWLAGWLAPTWIWLRRSGTFRLSFRFLFRCFRSGSWSFWCDDLRRWDPEPLIRAFVSWFLDVAALVSVLGVLLVWSQAEVSTLEKILRGVLGGGGRGWITRSW